MEKFEELKIRGQIVEDPEQALARFKAGLRADIKRELLGKDLYSVEHACQIATDVEEYLKHPITRRVGFQAGETAIRRYNDMNKRARTIPLQPLNRFYASKPSSSDVTYTKGIGFKLPPAPSHQWTPDVYEGVRPACFKCGEHGHMGMS